MKSRLFGVAAFGLCAFSLFGQTDQAVITGTITDSTQAVIPGAKVTAREANTNITSVHTTNESGLYVIGPVKIGVYEISVEAEGFKKAVRSGVELHPNDRIGLNFALEVGNIVEVVEVTGSTPILETETASLAYTVERRQIEEFPLNGRNYQSLALLTAGVTAEIGGRDRGPLGDAAIGGGFVAHGQGSLQNNYLIDGVDNNSTVMGLQDRKSQAVIPSLDAVQEFKVQTSNYSAEFGRNAGAVVNITIRSGTNQFHGSAYDFMRNDIFDAREAFGRTDIDGDGKADPEILRQNQFGGTLGGPIVRDRTFFFASWESWRVRKAQSDLVVIPTPTELSGDFSQTRGLAALKDPAGGTFANKTIPAARQDPVAVALTSLYPAPNLSGSTRNNFAAGPPWTTDRNQYDFRGDHRFSENDSFFARYSFSKFNNLRGAPLPDDLARGGVGNDRARDVNDGHHVAVSETHVFGPNLVNEARFGYKFLQVDKRSLTDILGSEANQRFGIKGIPDHDNIFGLPQIQLTGSLGFTGLGESGSLPNLKRTGTFQYLDNVTLIHGNHSLKFGADFRYDNTNINGGNQAHGQLQYNGRYTGISLGDMLLGMTNRSTLSTLLRGDMLFRSWMFYVQDDWKVTPNFTINLGLRYELTTPWFEENDRMNKILFAPGPDFGRTLKAGELGDSYSDRGLVNLDTNNFGPRIGFAWQPGSKWTVRSGVGRFFGGQQALGATARMIFNYPYFSQVVAQGNNTRPAFLLKDGFPAGYLGDPAVRPVGLTAQHWADDFGLPEVYQWNLSVQRQLAGDLALTVAYVGSSSSNIEYSYNLNWAGIGDPATEQKRRRLFQDINSFDYRSPAAHSSYHGMDVNLEKRFASGFMFTGAYTWAHSIGQTSEAFVDGDNGAAQNLDCFSCDRGATSNDVRQRFAGSYMIELPFGAGRRLVNRAGWINQVVGGWQLTGLMTLQTGQYYHTMLSNAVARLGTQGVGVWRPNVVGDHAVINPGPDGWYNPAAFAVPLDAAGNPTFGNVGRNSMQEPGIFNWDVGLMKTFPIGERIRLHFRWEIFNVTNHPSYGTPNRDIESLDAGTIRSTNTLPRQMQFGLRLTF